MFGPAGAVARRGTGSNSVTSEEDAIEAIGDMRELLADEDLLVPPGPP